MLLLFDDKPIYL